MKELTDEQLNEEICKWTLKRKNYILGPEALGNIHEVEKELTPNQQFLYLNYIANQIEAGCDSEQLQQFVPFATSRQRGIALLRVVKPKPFSR